jgi:hypothetical protein
MPLYEYVLRVPGRSDEVRLHERNGLRPGDEVRIMSRVWVVTGTTEAPRPPVAGRIILEPATNTPAGSRRL